MLSGLLRALFCASIVTGLGTKLGTGSLLRTVNSSDFTSDDSIAGAENAGALADESLDAGSDFERGDSRTLVRHLRITAYADRGLTAAGVPSGVGQCAAPADIPFGALIYIPELQRTFVVTDRTAQRFRRNTIDIFIADRSECLRFGRHYLDVLVYLPQRPHRYGSPSILNSVTAARTGDLTTALASCWTD